MQPSEMRPLILGFVLRLGKSKHGCVRVSVNATEDKDGSGGALSSRNQPMPIKDA